MGRARVRKFVCDERGCSSYCELHPTDPERASDALRKRGWHVVDPDDTDLEGVSLTCYCPGCKSRRDRVSVVESSD